MYADIPGRYEMKLDEGGWRYRRGSIEASPAHQSDTWWRADPGVIPPRTCGSSSPGSPAPARSPHHPDPATGASSSRARGRHVPMWVEARASVGALKGDFTVAPDGNHGCRHAHARADCRMTVTVHGDPGGGDFNGWNTSVASMTRCRRVCGSRRSTWPRAALHEVPDDNRWERLRHLHGQTPACLVRSRPDLSRVRGENALGGSTSRPQTNHTGSAWTNRRAPTRSRPSPRHPSARPWGRLKIRYR